MLILMAYTVAMTWGLHKGYTAHIEGIISTFDILNRSVKAVYRPLSVKILCASSWCVYWARIIVGTKFFEQFFRRVAKKDVKKDAKKDAKRDTKRNRDVEG
jgi:hypothetical protein